MNEFLTSRQVILRIVTIISVVEFSIMDGFIYLSADLSPYLEAVLDILLLAIITTPLIYLWVIEPYVRARDNTVEAMENLILTDVLTDLSNRHVVYANIDKSIAASAKGDVNGAIILFDLHGLKSVNERFGHDAGDAVLVETARRLRSHITSEDIAGRLNGDEFVIIVNRVSSVGQQVQNDVMALAEQLIKSVYEPIDINGKQLNVSGSIGVKLLGEGDSDSDKVMREADVALTQAKNQAGDGNIVIFNA
ncbi:MAG: GGDEF domain-containing protein [Mariprofundus sp.]|nr:GGDEF domain-containing protein [Mariprofundus sp.]